MLLDTLPSLPDAPLLVGFSGGLDSSVLLHLLAHARGACERGLRAVHVDHGLHPDSPRWAEHCRRFCAGLDIGLEVVPVEVGRSSGFGREAAARAARYAAFESVLRSGEILALAHHRDDQAETVLLRLLRASASHGLAAMREQRLFASGTIWRPLLHTPRQALLEYAQAQGLRWIEDPSNLDTGLDRNFLRHQVLPLLRRRWPQADAALASSARWLDEDAALLDAACDERLAELRGADPLVLAMPALLRQPPAWRSRLLRRWVRSCGAPPLPATAIETIARELLPARGDALAEFCWQGAVLRAWRGQLWLEPAARAALPRDWRCHWDGSDGIVLPNGLAFSCVAANDHAGGPFELAARQGGERLRLPGRQHHSELKRVLQDLGVPPWRRRQWPLVWSPAGELLAVGEILRSAEGEQRGLRFRLAI